jgi:type IV secretory pathway VirJ component
MSVRAALILAAMVLAAPAFAQQTPPPKEDDTDGVVVTADERAESRETQRKAEQTAGEARRLFAGLKDGGGNVGMACRSASQADTDYKQAIAEVESLVKDAQPQFKTQLEERAKGMKERRDNLEKLADRFCDGVVAKRKGGRQSGGRPGARDGRP